MFIEAFWIVVDIIGIILIASAIIFFCLVPVIEKWSKDSRREEEEARIIPFKVSDPDDEFMKIHHD
jgi:hypothetical protein